MWRGARQIEGALECVLLLVAPTDRETHGDAPGNGAHACSGGYADPGSLASGAEVLDRPAVLARDALQLAVRVNGNGVADDGQHGHVIGRVGVGRAAGQVEALAFGQRVNGFRLRRAVQRLPDEPSGVDAV